MIYVHLFSFRGIAQSDLHGKFLPSLKIRWVQVRHHYGAILLLTDLLRDFFNVPLKIFIFALQ